MGQFPKEFRGSMFRNPDWRFLIILFVCLFLIGGVTYLLSLRELSETTSQQEIVQIQDRYARLVLNIPVKVIKKTKAKELPPLKKKIQEKKEPIKKVEKKMEEPKSVEEKKVDIIPETPKIPEVNIKAMTKYNIKKSKLNLEAEEEKKIDIGKIDVPDISMDTFNKYDVRERALDINLESDRMTDRQLTLKAPEINIQSSSRYNVKEKALGLDLSDQSQRKINVAQKMPEVKSFANKKYGSTGSKGSSNSQNFDISDRKKRSFNMTSKAPDLGKKPTTKYGTVRSARGSDISMEDKTKRRKPLVVAAKEIPAVQPKISRRKYGGTPVGSSKKTYTSTLSSNRDFTPGRGERGGTRKKATVVLPQTTGIQNLSACIDPSEETRLKRKILAAVDYDGRYCEDNVGKYAFLNIEMISTMDIRFKSKKAGRYNRCDALNMALQCLTR